jgi:hypothetical protein
LKRGKPDALAGHEAQNVTSLARIEACAARHRIDGLYGRSPLKWQGISGDVSLPAKQVIRSLNPLLGETVFQIAF